MKKTLIFALCAFLAACSPKDTTKEKTVEAENSLDKETVFSFDVSNLNAACETDSEIICAVNNTIKCILNPNLDLCQANKNNMPPFVFMQDESLQRPTFQSYKITKLSPREDGAVEIHTQSSCNGNWFGLCNGNIIYVMKNIDSIWRVTDMYALEF